MTVLRQNAAEYRQLPSQGKQGCMNASNGRPTLLNGECQNETIMAASIGKQDPRYDTLKKGRNLRWPASPNDVAHSIELCESPEDVAMALQRVVDAGRRPTIRSGG